MLLATSPWVWLLVIIYLVFIVLLMVKNNVTYKNMLIIFHAIDEYQTIQRLLGRCNCILVSFDDMRSYDATLLRFWDWGYARILPPEKFRIVEPYILKKKA